MWLATTRGFYSIVAHRDDESKLLVRSRVEGDLLALRELIPTLEIASDDSADYRWRATIDRASFLGALVSFAADLDYPNFKAAVGKRQGPNREALYGRVWATLLDLEEVSARDELRDRRDVGE